LRAGMGFAVLRVLGGIELGGTTSRRIERGELRAAAWR
jgi:hypothetical protein